MWQNMADGVALSWQSETKLYSAWSGSASFTPRHILWWTEAAQHVKILWETLVFSTVTLNPHSLIRKGNYHFGCLYTDSLCKDRQRKCVVELYLHYCPHWQYFWLCLQTMSKAQVAYIHGCCTGLTDSCAHEQIGSCLCKMCLPVLFGWFFFYRVMPNVWCPISLSVCQILITWASDNYPSSAHLVAVWWLLWISDCVIHWECRVIIGFSSIPTA